MAFFSEETLHRGFGYVKKNLVPISKISILVTDLVLFILAVAAFADKKYPGLGVYLLLVFFAVLAVELVFPMVVKEAPNGPAVEKMQVVLEFMTPLKKCVIYGIAALLMLIHFTLAALGAVMMIVCALLFAGQYEDSRTVTIPDSNGDDGPITGISAGDVIMPGTATSPSSLEPAMSPVAEGQDNNNNAPSSPIPNDWDFTPKGDEVLLLG